MTQLNAIPNAAGLIDNEGNAVHMHWGVLLHQETPTTGVYGGNQLDWEYMPYDWIDLDYETAVSDIEDDPNLTSTEKDDAIEELSNYFDSGDTHLYGSWKKVDGQYEADRETDDPEDFAAIYNANYNTLQVVWSKVIKRGALASPCYPGQVSANEDDGDDGQQAYYALPESCIYTEAKHKRNVELMAHYMAEQDEQRRNPRP
jgi:hypothetical protein